MNDDAGSKSHQTEKCSKLLPVSFINSILPTPKNINTDIKQSNGTDNDIL